MELSFEPSCGQWRELLADADADAGTWQGVSIAEWRRRTRGELGLAVDRPVVATGHQTLLWHPGILIKYLAVGAMIGDGQAIAAANLVVDQHTAGYGSFDAPGRDPELSVRAIALTAARPGVPMGWHPAFVPPDPPAFAAALPSVEAGIGRIFAAVRACTDRPSAALQMAAALRELMSPWVRPGREVSSSDLMRTSLAAAILREMDREPRACASAYNTAVAASPEGGIIPLAVTDDRVELPLWRRGAGDRREYADNHDLGRWIAGGDDRPVLLPRALLLTLLVRLGMCDLFVHGTGGARYDRAMERWVEGWLGLAPAPIAVATATLRLPLGRAGEQPVAMADAQRELRRAWHDPEPGSRPGPLKSEILAAIETADRRSRRRLDAFRRLHKELERLRRDHADRTEAAERQVELARRQALEAPIAARRDWAFPLYPPEMIDDLAVAVNAEIP